MTETFASGNEFLRIDGVNASYGDLRVLNDVSLSVDAGETYGLIGLNGAGKTTLLKIILGLKDAVSGKVGVAGYEAGSDAAQKNLAFLPERFDPAWFLSAYEFIDFTLALYGQKIARAKIDDMAERLGLKTMFLKKRAQSYSKGMRQKLGLMTVLLTECPLLILDEPMSGLDPLARAQVKDILIDIRKEGRTTFLSSHILSDMEELCDRVAVLHDGDIKFIGKPSALIEETGQAGLERAFLSLTGLDAKRAA